MTAKTIEAAPCPFHGTLCEYVPMAHKSVEQAAEIERLRAALRRWQQSGCPDCGGDCSSANPPVACCIVQETRAALAAPSGAIMENPDDKA